MSVLGQIGWQAGERRGLTRRPVGGEDAYAVFLTRLKALNGVAAAAACFQTDEAKTAAALGALAAALDGIVAAASGRPPQASLRRGALASLLLHVHDGLALLLSGLSQRAA